MKSFLRKFSVILFILLNVMVFSPISWAETPSAAIGLVVWTKGAVKAVSIDHKERALQRRSPLYLNDTIVTDKSGTGEVVFSDSSVLALSPDSALRIDEYQFDKKSPSSPSKFIATLVKGGFRTTTGLIPKANPKNYRVNTPVATIGVYGTEYAVIYRGQLTLGYYKGKPCVKNKMGTFCVDSKQRVMRVRSFDSAPEILPNDSMSELFADQPDLTSIGKLEDSALSGGSVGSGSGGKTSGKPKTVGGFCIQ